MGGGCIFCFTLRASRLTLHQFLAFFTKKVAGGGRWVAGAFSASPSTIHASPFTNSLPSLLKKWRVEGDGWRVHFLLHPPRFTPHPSLTLMRFAAAGLAFAGPFGAHDH